MILVSILIYRIISRFPIILVAVFSIFSLGHDVIAEEEIVEDIYELEEIVCAFEGFAKEVKIKHDLKEYSWLVVNFIPRLDSVSLYDKHYLLNCSWILYD